MGPPPSDPTVAPATPDALAAALVLQLATAVYFLVFLLMAGAVVLVSAILLPDGRVMLTRVLQRAWLPLAVCGVLAAALARGVPTVNGRYGGTPRLWRLRDLEVRDAAQREQLRSDLERWCRSQGLDPGAVAWIDADHLLRAP